MTWTTVSVSNCFAVREHDTTFCWSHAGSYFDSSSSSGSSTNRAFSFFVDCLNLESHLASKNKAEGQTEDLAVEIGYGRGNIIESAGTFSHTTWNVASLCDNDAQTCCPRDSCQACQNCVTALQTVRAARTKNAWYVNCCLLFELMFPQH